MPNELLLSAPLAAAIIVSLFLAAYVWWRSGLRVRPIFTLMSVEVAFLAATYWMELVSLSLAGKLFWNGLEYIVNVTIPPLFLLFTLIFLGREGVRRPLCLGLLFVVPFISLTLVWTNDLHHLFYSTVGLPEDPWFMAFTHTYNVGFFVHSVYSLALLLTAVALLAAELLRSSPMHRRQIGLVLIASLLPLFSLALGFSEVVDLSLTYFFVLGFVGAGVLIFLGTFMYELFDIVPVALEAIVETVDDGIVVIDRLDWVLFANDTILEHAKLSAQDAYAQPVSVLSAELSDDAIQAALRGERREVVLGDRGDERTYRLKATPIVNREGTVTSLVLTLRDITEEKQASESLKVANTKLNLLSSITRHDTLNQVAVIRGYGEIMAERASDEEVRRYGQRITTAAEYIEKQFLFAKDYQSLGLNPPQWQSAALIFERAKGFGLAGGIEAEARLDGVEVLADPLLDRVFTVLMDNSRRHGRRVTKITAGYRVEDDSLVIVYEDDGVGICLLDKQRIFERGYGTDSGLGLFLARQILEVTGMTIREVGVCEKGARFEIVVPPGRWRRSQP